VLGLRLYPRMSESLRGIMTKPPATATWGSPFIHAACPLASQPFRIALPEATSRIRRACLIYARWRCERRASPYSAHLAMDDSQPGGTTIPLPRFRSRPTVISRPPLAGWPAFRAEPHSLLGANGERRHFSASADAVCATPAFRQGAPFHRPKSPPAQLLTRRCINGSKQCTFAHRESRYLVSFRHAMATRRPRPTLTVWAELGVCDGPATEVLTRATPRLSSDLGLVPFGSRRRVSP